MVYDVVDQLVRAAVPASAVETLVLPLRGGKAAPQRRRPGPAGCFTGPATSLEIWPHCACGMPV